MLTKIALIFLASTTTTAYSGCNYQPPPVTAVDTAKSNQLGDKQIGIAASAANAYNEINIVENGEQENIVRYVNETTKPGLVGYIVLLTLGRPIAYYTVKGPVTDCNRELTPMQHPASAYIGIDNSYNMGNGGNTTDYSYMADSPNDEGTYGGGNNPCIFFYTEDGILKRWSDQYLYSDQPIRLSEKPLVITEVSTHK